MGEITKANRNAWQPLTFGGVAAFANAPLKRLLLVQFIFALLIAALVVWFLDTAWFPTVAAAIRQLPPAGKIRAGKLDWPDGTPRLLAGGHFLALVADLNHRGEIKSPADLQVDLTQDHVRFISLFGYTDVDYPPDGRWIIALNRTELEPWWGAWAPPILWITFAVTLVGLMALWALLATLYLFPVWLAGFFANRRLSLWGSWKLAGAALLPGALLLAAAILFYGFGILDLVQLAAAWLTHLAAGWMYSLVSPFFAPKLPSLIPANPFVAPAGEAPEEKKK